MEKRTVARWTVPFITAAAALAMVLMVAPALMAAAQSGPDWPMYRADPEHSGFTASDVPEGPALLWLAQAGTHELTSPVGSGGMVYVGSADGNLYALWAGTGGEAWHFQVGDGVRAEPAVEGSTVYVVSEDGRLCAVGAERGELLWETDLPSGLTDPLPLTIDSGDLYITIPSGQILKLSTAERGRVLWHADAGARMAAPVTVGEGQVFAVAEGGKVAAFFSSNGTPCWTVHPGFGSSEEETTALMAGRLYLGTKGKDVYCLDHASGTVLWTTSVRSTVQGSPAVAYGNMIVGTENGLVYALNTSDGNISWTYDIRANLTPAPSIAGGYVFLSTDEGELHMVRASTGQLILLHRAGGERVSPPAISEGRILLSARDGRVMAFGRPSQPLPVARLELGASRVSAGENVTFSAGNSTGTTAAPLAGYFCDFGDGTASGWLAGPRFNHSYAQKGNYTVSLKVRDQSGNESEPVLGRVTVFNFRPVVQMSVEGTAVAGKPVRFSLSMHDPDGQLVNYEMDFEGDGQVDSLGSPVSSIVHIYTSNGTYRPRLWVFDDNGTFAESSIELGVAAAPAGPAGATPSPLAQPAVVASVSLVSLAAVGLVGLSATEFGKYKLLTLLFVPLYVRLKHDEVLDNYIRGQIHGYIIANPGDHYNSIRDGLELSNGIVAHHLATLEREGLIQSMRDGMYKRFFPANAKLPPEDEGHFNIQKRIVAIIKNNPGISQKEIAQKVGVSSPTVNYHVSVLATARMIRVEKVGRRTHCYVAEQQPPT